MNRLTNLKHYRKEYVRALYGKHGKSSGLKPGVMWPRKEELLYLKQYEEAFCPKLDDLIADNQAKKEAALKARLDREREVLRNLESLPEAFESFFNKLEEKKAEQEKIKEERERMIEEVRDILGFRASPSDDRFQEALAQREQEEIKAKRKEARLKRQNAGLNEMLAGQE